MKINLYPEMNSKIAKLLRLSEQPAQMYAAALIDAYRASGLEPEEIPRWIPVSERLPEDCLSERETLTRVQIRCILSSGKRVFFGSRTRYGTDKKWFWNRGSNITRWMPLPQPPKEEK